MEKIIIHTVTIKTKLAKKLFQVVLPENTEAITGIAILNDVHKIPLVEMGDVGRIRLHVADSGDKFFSQVLQAYYLTPSFQRYGLIDGFYMTMISSKNQFEFAETYQPTENTLIEGYYEDIAGAKLSDAFEYHVRIYLRLKMTQL
ncbi:hypothetical protein BH11BAC7_BH11BAC7_21340 [soil metagenome]